MKKHKFTLWLSIIGALVMLAAAGFTIWKFKYQADTNSVLIAGTVREALDYQVTAKSAAGVEVLFRSGKGAELCTSGSCGSCEKEFKVVTDKNGQFSKTIIRPCDCPYRVIAGGSNTFNATDNGTINLTNKGQTNGGRNSSKLELWTNRETDMMWSSYFSTNYPSGYQGRYRLSQWDTYIIRNPIKTDQILTPQGSQKASFKIPLEPIAPRMELTNGAPNGPAGSPNFKFNAMVTVRPVMQPWLQIYQTNLGPVVASQQITFDLSSSSSIEFKDIDLSKLKPNEKYNAWVNGFAISMRLLDNTNSNPYLVIPKSEDRNYQPVTAISYSQPSAINDTCLKITNNDLIPATVSSLTLSGGKTYTIPDGGAGGVSEEDHLTTLADPTRAPASLRDGIFDHLKVTNFSANCPCSQAICAPSRQKWTPACGGAFGQGCILPTGKIPTADEPWIMNARWKPLPPMGTKVIITYKHNGVTRAVVAVAGYEIGPGVAESHGNVIGAQEEVLAALNAEHHDAGSANNIISFGFAKDQTLKAGTTYVSCDN